ncbi:GntR family transcriptional regulator [Vibrio sp. vnigr-6D03]|uniref:aminotransferase-like domain-containing protein n=1 Tax=Vibrio sp. vnigr-6D03 TaxID=2058088 RepID=UPI000C342C10|nr:PLP-dependent aminotransferase family protein [Vibrio sp. vnigr-6D03]PKF77530.1 GntR family transcriptional regulator [Vibrio sp. vnigr-6D03]
MKKPQKLAHELKKQIEHKIWQSGEKIPSIRETCKRYGLSIETVLQAYQLLENQGYVKSKPKSGYFVLPRRTVEVQSQNERKKLQPFPVKISDLLYDVVQRAKDPSIIPLSSAFPDPALFPHQALSRSLASASRQMPSNSMLTNLPPGSESLRRQIAQRYQHRGVNVLPDDIVITSGAMEALSLSLQSCTEPGDLVAIEYPAFYGALQAIERLNLTAVEIPTDAVNGLDLGALESALATMDIKACWFMTHAQNPVGFSLSEEKKRDLATLVARYQVPMIEDDVYGELYSGTTAPLPAKAYDESNQIMLCGSFSKSLSPGFRIGWVVAGDRALSIQRLQHLSTLSTSIPIQLALSHYLTFYNYDNHLKKLRKILNERKKAYIKSLTESLPKSAKVVASDGGYFVWVELEQKVNVETMYEAALKANISIAPGIIFSSDKLFCHHLRINTSYPCDDRVLAAVTQLGVLIQALSDSASG